MCRAKDEGGRRCSLGGTPAVEAVTGLLGAAARDENEHAPAWQSDAYYRYRRAARAAWQSTLHAARERLVQGGVNPDEEVPTTEARAALGGAIKNVEDMGWLSKNERATAARRLTRVQKNARRHPITRVVLTALLHAISQLVLGRDNARRVFALAGLVERARLDRAREIDAERAKAEERENTLQRQHYEDTFEHAV